MNDILSLISALLTGLFLGAIFFGGLWWTVQKGLSSRKPAIWFLGSFLLRATASVAGFDFASGGHWERLLVCLLSFFIMRRVVICLIKLPAGESNKLARELDHATQP